jgi:endonuclease YncB( thermonuclease family)
MSEMSQRVSCKIAVRPETDTHLQNSEEGHLPKKRNGAGWYRKHAPGDTVLEGLETKAKAARKGLWADPQPVPPWEWRKRSR